MVDHYKECSVLSLELLLESLHNEVVYSAIAFVSLVHVEVAAVVPDCLMMPFVDVSHCPPHSIFMTVVNDVNKCLGLLRLIASVQSLQRIVVRQSEIFNCFSRH